MSLAEHSVGDGPNLTLVHGWGLGSAAWRSVVPALAKIFTVHLVELPGYGASAPRDDNGLEALADALAETLPPRAMLCGWSLGAMVCLCCAARHPRKVARLALTAATASFVCREGWINALTHEQLDGLRAELEADPKALLRRFPLMVNQGDSQARAAARALRANAPQVDGVTLGAGLAVLAGADLRRLATQVMQPTLLIHGSADTLMPVGAAHSLARLLNDASVDIFEGSAHAPFASDPARFVAAVSRFAGVEP